MKKSPIRPADDDARALARSLIAKARFAALAFTHPETGAPFVSRVALGLSPAGMPISLVSTLALHTRALREAPRCALLIGEPPAKGDPLAFPRLSMSAMAEFIGKEPQIRDCYLAGHPKSRTYVDFADFGFVLFRPLAAALNGGFGKAYNLGPADLCKEPGPPAPGASPPIADR